MTSKRILSQTGTEKKVVYSYHGIVKRQTYVIPRFVARLFRFGWFKRLFFSIPAVDNAVLLQEKAQQNSVTAELELGFLGLFKHNWEVNTWMLEALLRLPVVFNAVHGVYFPETYRPLPFFKRLVFDLTEFNDYYKKAIRKQIQITDILGEDSAPKVIVFHPIPLAYDKKEKEIIKGIKSLVKTVLPLLEETNTYIAIENMPKLRKPREAYFPLLGSVQFFEKLMDAINHSHVGITFDWGHANSYARFMYEEDRSEPGFDFTPESLANFGYQEYFLRELKDKIFHLHINYNEAHKLKKKPPRFFMTNFDTHQELTRMGYFEYENYKRILKIVLNSPNLIGATLELMPRTLWPAKPYSESVKLFKAMLK